MGSQHSQSELARLRAHDKQAWEELIAQYRPGTLALAKRILRNPDDARELTQEAWIKAWQSIEQFRGGNLQAWIYSIVANRAKNQLRYLALRHAISLEPEHHGIEPTGPDQHLDVLQLATVVQQALDELDPRFKAVWLLRDLEELSYKEICEVTGTRLGTVQSRIHRARIALRAKLAHRHTEM